MSNELWFVNCDTVLIENGWPLNSTSQLNLYLQMLALNLLAHGLCTARKQVNRDFVYVTVKVIHTKIAESLDFKITFTLLIGSLFWSVNTDSFWDKTEKARSFSSHKYMATFLYVLLRSSQTFKTLTFLMWSSGFLQAFSVVVFLLILSAVLASDHFQSNLSLFLKALNTYLIKQKHTGLESK